MPTFREERAVTIMFTSKKIGSFVVVSLAALCLLAFVPRMGFGVDHPVLGGDKRADKATARLGDSVTITIDVNGSGVPVQTMKTIKHPVDILIMMDSSESYFQEIRTMQTKFSDLISGLSAKGLNLTVGFIVFGNSKTIGECPINTDGSPNAAATRQLTKDTASLIPLINSLIAWGQWEPWGDAIWLGNNWATWRGDAYKIAILVTDESCDKGRKVPGPLSLVYSDAVENFDGPQLWSEVNTAASKKIKYITIDSGAGLVTTQLKKVASLTDGLYYNFSHAKATDFVKAINDTVTEVVQGELKETAGHNVVVTDTVSSQVELVAGSFNVPPSSQVTNLDGSITLKWNLGDIKYNESKRMTYRIKMISCGEIPTNVAAVVDYLDWEGVAKSITLPLPKVTVPHPTIESCDSTGAEVDTFNPSETVYVTGENYGSSASYAIYVVEDVATWVEGMSIPARVAGTTSTVTSNGAGIVGPAAVWSAPLMPGKYDIVVDVNGNGKYDSGIDALDSGDVQITGGFLVIPEYPMGAIVGLAGCLAAFGAFRVVKRKTF